MMPWMQWKEGTLLRLLIFTVLMSFLQGACHWEQCRMKFDDKLRALSLRMEDEPSWTLCLELEKLATCLTSNAKSCRGNLYYHSYAKYVTRGLQQKNCSHILTDTSQHGVDRRNFRPSTTPEPFVVLPLYHGCSTINLTQDVAYCAIFGDPHIITHRGTFQTCTMRGAYPLIENRHLAIQVISKDVRRSSHSTVVTSVARIAIVIKASECCPERKGYEARLGHLPGRFTDNTTHTETLEVVVRKPNQLVEVRILHLKTLIFIRQIGEYLSVSVRLPKSLAEMESTANFQMCGAGCPPGEAVDRADAMKDVAFRPVKQAEQWCQRENLTGPFYQACFFDSVMTLDYDAVVMSLEAQLDWERLAPVDAVRTAAWTTFGPDYEDHKVASSRKGRNAGAIDRAGFGVAFFLLLLACSCCWRP